LVDGFERLFINLFVRLFDGFRVIPTLGPRYAAPLPNSNVIPYPLVIPRFLHGFNDNGYRLALCSLVAALHRPFNGVPERLFLQLVRDNPALFIPVHPAAPGLFKDIVLQRKSFRRMDRLQLAAFD
jgi:hypothetical protein